MRKSHRDKQNLTVLRTEFAPEDFAELWRLPAHVEHDIQHAAPRAINHFRMGSRWGLKMHPAQHTFGRGRIKFLAQGELNSRRAKSFLVERLYKGAPAIFEKPRLQ